MTKPSLGRDELAPFVGSRVIVTLRGQSPLAGDFDRLTSTGQAEFIRIGGHDDPARRTSVEPGMITAIERISRWVHTIQAVE